MCLCYKLKNLRGENGVTLPILIDNDSLEVGKYDQKLQVRNFRATDNLNFLRSLVQDIVAIETFDHVLKNP